MEHFTDLCYRRRGGGGGDNNNNNNQGNERTVIEQNY